MDEELFKYVQQNDIPKAVKILVEKDVNPNGYRDSLGDTALYAAVRNHNLSLVKLLILFDADLQVVNKKNETPLDLALTLGAKECAQAIESILLPLQQLAKDGPKTGEIKSPPTKDDDDINLLCLDGGGIKGLVLVEVMLQIEKRCRQLYGSQLQKQHTNFLSYFNWIGGNSTGGLCTLAIACGKTPKEGRKLYYHLKSKILTQNPPYPRELVDEHYQKIYGATKTMSDIKDRNVTIMTTMATTNPPKLHIMSNYGEPRDGMLGPDKRRVWEAARATSAAVPYFHPYHEFMDGGFIANNPTVDTIVDICRQRKRNANVKVVLSLGCGYETPSSDDVPDFQSLQQEKYMAIEKCGIKILVELIKDKFGSSDAHLAELIITNLHSTLTLVKLMGDQIVQPCGEVQVRGEVLAEKIGAHYFRLNPKIEPISFVEKDDKRLIDMMFMAMAETLKRPMIAKIDKIIELVLGNGSQWRESNIIIIEQEPYSTSALWI